MLGTACERRRGYAEEIHPALTVALAAHHGAAVGAIALDADAVISTFRQHVKGEELLDSLDAVERHLQRQSTPTNHTVPAAIYCWLRYPDDSEQAVTSVIALGGDTDTTGAIVGALAGATCGSSAIPAEWIDGLLEWPRTTGWMRSLAGELRRLAPPY